MSLDFLNKFEPIFAERMREKLRSVGAPSDQRYISQFRALASRGIKDPGQTLEWLTDEHDANDWALAAVALAVSQDQKYIKPIEEKLYIADNVDLKYACLNALSGIGDNKSLAAISDFLSKTNSVSDQLAAITNIELFFGNRHASAILVTQLSDSSELVRAQAARSLGVVDAGGERELIAALDDASPAVRFAAAEALATVGGPEAVRPLRELEAVAGNLVTEDGLVSEAVHFALENIARAERGD